MAHNGNGSGYNGGGDKDPDDDKLIRFPTLAERDMMRKIRERQEQEWRDQYKSGQKSKKVPFFNAGKIPPFTKAIVAIFVIIHLALYLLVHPETIGTIIYTFGFVPGNFTGVSGEFPYLSVLSPVSYIFIHGNWMHLVFNCIMMFGMGTLFERNFGARATAFMFFACGFGGALACLILSPFSVDPVIGASGSITGLFGATTMLLYQQRQMGRIAKRRPIPLIVFWALFIVVIGLVSGDTSWQAHLGGFFAGVGVLHLMQKGKLKFRR